MQAWGPRDGRGGDGRTRILLLGVRQVRDQPPPTRIRLDFRRQRAGVHDKTIEFHHPSYRVVRQQLSPREFRIEMLHLQKLPDLLCFVAERALRDAGELAKLIARHEDILGSIEQEINAADDVERRGAPDPQIPRARGEGRLRASLAISLRHNCPYSASRCSVQNASVSLKISSQSSRSDSGI